MLSSSAFLRSSSDASIDLTEHEYMRLCEAEGMLRVEQTPMPQSSILFRGNYDLDSASGDFTANLSYSGCTNCVHLLTNGLFDFVESGLPATGLFGEQPDNQILVPERIFQDARLMTPEHRYYVKFSLAAEGHRSTTRWRHASNRNLEFRLNVACGSNGSIVRVRPTRI